MDFSREPLMARQVLAGGGLLTALYRRRVLPRPRDFPTGRDSMRRGASHQQMCSRLAQRCGE
ncbi:hypothetical protein ASC99_34035 [Kitasatospora sp. Root107]|nr:hypothetical protein ASC99_34035 [Kitasatospora sp. Root107]